ncbi:MAG: hypothetical protein AAF518_01005 [Spirochaetota bacterium]
MNAKTWVIFTTVLVFLLNCIQSKPSAQFKSIVPLVISSYVNQITSKTPKLLSGRLVNSQNQAVSFAKLEFINQTENSTALEAPNSTTRSDGYFQIELLPLIYLCNIYNASNELIAQATVNIRNDFIEIRIFYPSNSDFVIQVIEEEAYPNSVEFTSPLFEIDAATYNLPEISNFALFEKDGKKMIRIEGNYFEGLKLGMQEGFLSVGEVGVSFAKEITVENNTLTFPPNTSYPVTPRNSQTIILELPSDTLSGYIYVGTIRGIATSSAELTFQPQITSVSRIDSTDYVQIIGQNFSTTASTNAVSYNSNQAANVISASQYSLLVNISNAVTLTNITVDVAGKSVTYTLP